ncbi:hypothetical protein BDQ17DRAFT_1358097 [Cyathus striatus]|nr:hypothetical protein BDQ17DRAFT_1358097 [Cyathus striatus]
MSFFKNASGISITGSPSFQNIRGDYSYDDRSTWRSTNNHGLYNTNSDTLDSTVNNDKYCISEGMNS